MIKIGEFIYPWGFGHYSRIMILNDSLPHYLKDEEYEIHYSSKAEVYQRLLEKFPTKKKCIHKISMPTPIDGRVGPSVTLSMVNVLFPVSNNPPLLKQIPDYLKDEGKLYDREKFDLVINDGDVGSNVVAERRNIPCMFITNQFMPKLWKRRFYFYPSLIFVAKQMAKATKIIVADSPPPYTICEYNLNFPEKIRKKVTYVGHFAKNPIPPTKPSSDLEKLIENTEFGYWMRTGNKSTNQTTGRKYETVFQNQEMKNERRIVSHAKNDASIDRVIGKNGKNYSVSDALDKKIDWIQIDIGLLTENQKNSVLRSCKYAVVNGSHTSLGEIVGSHKKPIIGIPIYDEHTNQLKWIQGKSLGKMAKNVKQVIKSIFEIKENYNKYQEKINDFSLNFVGNGAENTAKIVSEMLEEKNN